LEKKINLQDNDRHSSEKEKTKQPHIKLTQSIKFASSDQAATLLRKAFSLQIAVGPVGRGTKPKQLRDILTETSSLYASGDSNVNRGAAGNSESKDGIISAVIDRYWVCCRHWNAKPNSQVLSSIHLAEPVMGDDGVEISYDFENAHIGDRGCACLLHALALDRRIVNVSLRSCCLRGGAGPVLGVFIEMHARLRSIDLSRNSLSFQFGELLLEAFERREMKTEFQVRFVDAGHAAGVGDHSEYGPVDVNMEGTWFGWDRCSGHTVGPPCGNLWAGLSDDRAKLTPVGYDSLRSRLDSTGLINFKSKDHELDDERRARPKFLGQESKEPKMVRRGTGFRLG
jgi:hypothetical protein